MIRRIKYLLIVSSKDSILFPLFFQLETNEKRENDLILQNMSKMIIFFTNLLWKIEWSQILLV